MEVSMCKSIILITSLFILCYLPKSMGDKIISTPPPAQVVKAAKEYQAKDYSSLLGMLGFSDALLKMHFQLYQGYVKNTNLLLNQLHDMSAQDKSSSYEYGALKRRL